MKLLVVVLSIAGFFIWLNSHFSVTVSRYPDYGSAAYHNALDQFMLQFSVYDNSIYWFLGFMIIVSVLVGYIIGKKKK